MIIDSILLVWLLRVGGVHARACLRERERRGGWRIERRMEMKERKKEGEGNPEKGVETDRERETEPDTLRPERLPRQ